MKIDRAYTQNDNDSRNDQANESEKCEEEETCVAPVFVPVVKLAPERIHVRHRIFFKIPFAAPRPSSARPVAHWRCARGLRPNCATG